MKDGEIVQCGKYEKLRQSNLDFNALAEAHDTSMELVGASTTVSCADDTKAPESVPVQSEVSSEPGQSKPDKGSSKLIEDEERETGHISMDVYKQYCIEAYGWWGISAVMLVSVLWQLSQMSSDYWLAYETSGSHSFVVSLFIGVYSGIAVVTCAFLVVRSILVAFMGLKTAQSFFNQTVDSILHAPMSFFDTTPSGRVLSRVSFAPM